MTYPSLEEGPNIVQTWTTVLSWYSAVCGEGDRKLQSRLSWSTECQVVVSFDLTISTTTLVQFKSNSTSPKSTLNEIYLCGQLFPYFCEVVD